MTLNYIEILGFIGGGLMVLTLAMRTIIPLRLTAIISSLFQIAFALFAGILPMLVQHAVMLPMNLYRLLEQVRLVKRVKFASESDLSMDWLIPFMSHRLLGSGKTVFRKGDAADEMFILVSGKLVLTESDTEILPGAVVGELALLAPNRARTQTLQCLEDSEVMAIKYDRVKSLYFENPRFGFYFLRLTSARLFQNIAGLESKLEARDAEIARLNLLLQKHKVESKGSLAAE